MSAYRLTVALLVAAFLVLALRPGHAVEVAGLYEAEVAVAGKSEADRSEAFRQALVRVAVKLTGQRNPLESSRLRAALADAPRFVQQYQYRTASVVLPESQDVVTTENRLWAKFDPASIDSMIAESGLPRWSRVRPEVLLWIGVEDLDRSVLGADDLTGLAAAVRKAARERGIPVVFPLLDLEDQMQLSVADIWAGFDERIRTASNRYQPGAIMVARVERAGNALWSGQASLMAGAGTQRWRLDGESAGALLEQAMHQAGDLLASRYAGTSGDFAPAQREALIGGVETLADYTRTIAYLDQLDEITAVQINSVEENRLKVSLSLRSGLAALRKLIGLGVVLEEVSAAQSEELRFRLLR